MSNHDEATDAVLNALRAADPSVGFEARVQHALQQGTGPRRTIYAPWMLVAAVSILLCGVAVRLGLPSRNTPRAVVLVKALPAPAPALTSAATHTLPDRPRAVRVHAAHSVSVAGPKLSGMEAAVTHQNIPPPPLPLTQEERLVLRMMRHNTLPQLAALSPEARAHSLHEDAEQYRTFFAARPPLDGQPYYDQHISGEAQ